MHKLDQSQFVIGTSAWGSRIPVSRAVKLGTELVANGFHHFDTAPTYGSSYAQYALNRLAQQVAATLIVDTKYGQLNELDARGIAKKLLRAPSIAGLAGSFWQHSVRDRTQEAFWDPDRVFEAYTKAREVLRHTTVGAFYYHAPARPVLGTNTFNLCNRLNAEGVRLGVSNPVKKDLVWLSENADSHLVVLMDIHELQRHYDLVRSFENVDIRVHGLFRDRQDAHNRDAPNVVPIAQIIEEYFTGQPNRKFVIGVNSQRSLERLLQFVDSSDYGTYFQIP